MLTTHARVTVLFFSLLLTLCSCTIHRTPRIEDATYKNYEYEFKLRIPSGWQVRQEMTKGIEEGLAGHFSKDFVVMLIHPRNEGMIIVQADKSDDDILAMGYNRDGFRESLAARLAEKEAEMTESGQFTDYRYEIGSLTVKQGYGPSFLYNESAANQAGEQFDSSLYLTRCQNDASCEIRVTLIAKKKTFQKNYPVYTKVRKSVKKVYR